MRSVDKFPDMKLHYLQVQGFRTPERSPERCVPKAHPETEPLRKNPKAIGRLPQPMLATPRL